MLIKVRSCVKDGSIRCLVNFKHLVIWGKALKVNTDDQKNESGRYIYWIWSSRRVEYLSCLLAQCQLPKAGSLHSSIFEYTFAYSRSNRCCFSVRFIRMLIIRSEAIQNSVRMPIIWHLCFCWKVHVCILLRHEYLYWALGIFPPTTGIDMSLSMYAAVTGDGPWIAERKQEVPGKKQLL